MSSAESHTGKNIIVGGLAIGAVALGFRVYNDNECAAKLLSKDFGGAVGCALSLDGGAGSSATVTEIDLKSQDLIDKDLVVGFGVISLKLGGSGTFVYNGKWWQNLPGPDDVEMYYNKGNTGTTDVQAIPGFNFGNYETALNPDTAPTETERDSHIKVSVDVAESGKAIDEIKINAGNMEYFLPHVAQTQANENLWGTRSWALGPFGEKEKNAYTYMMKDLITTAAMAQGCPEEVLKMDAVKQALAWDNFKGKYAIGRISRGRIRGGDQVTLCKKDGTFVKSKVELVFMSHGVSKFEVPEGVAGDIVQLTGIGNSQIGETVADVDQPEALPVLEVEAPTLQIYLGPNTSPFKGQEAEFNTSRQIGDRLQKELETNVGLRVADEGIGFKVSGRGELHLSVLIETIRREGFEFEVGRPQVVTIEEDGETKEPVEEVIIEVPAEHVGTVQMELGQRRATLIEQFASPKGVTKLIYELPTRALIGLRNILMTGTKGTIVMNTLVTGYQPVGQALQQLRSGVLISFEQGVTTPYALQNAEARGTTFVGPAEKVYAGQIIGLNQRMEDMEINVCKQKHLTNMRSSSSDGVVQLTPPTIFSLEQCLDFIEKDELLEVTPKSLRLRKRELDPNKRKRQK